MGRVVILVRNLVLGIVALLCGASGPVRAASAPQQFDARNFGGISIPHPPNFRTEVDHVLIKCNENKFLIDKAEYWSAANELVRVWALNRELPFNFSEFKEFTRYAALQEIVCGKDYGGIGVMLAPDNGSFRVAEVLSGSPAEKVGVIKDDVITDVNGDSVSGLTLEQAIEKLRGPPRSKVDLTICVMAKTTLLSWLSTATLLKGI